MNKIYQFLQSKIGLILVIALYFILATSPTTSSVRQEAFGEQIRMLIIIVFVLFLFFKWKSVFSWLIWWKLDKEELKKQVEEYETLKIYQSARGISLLFIIWSVVVITRILLNEGSSDFFDIFLFLILGFFIYKGHRWAMIGIMLLYTLNSFFSMRSYLYPITVGIFHLARNFSLYYVTWAIYMHALYLAFKVEGLRAKAKKELINVNTTVTEGKGFDKSERLAELKNKGVITEEDFNKKKKQILDYNDYESGKNAEGGLSHGLPPDTERQAQGIQSRQATPHKQN